MVLRNEERWRSASSPRRYALAVSVLVWQSSEGEFARHHVGTFMAREDGATTALVLSSGVAYAAYTVGALKALCGGHSPATGYRELRPGIVVGTSAGALNAAFLASRPVQAVRQAVEDLERLWLEELAEDPARGRDGAIRLRGDLGSYGTVNGFLQNPVAALERLAGDSAYFTRSFFDRAIAYASSSEPAGRRVVELLSLSGLVLTANFRQIVERTIEFAGIRRSDLVLRVAATKWRTGELRLFRNEEMSDELGPSIVAASAAFPGLPPVLIDGEPFVDGGYVESRPLRPAWDAGASVMHVIYHRRDFSDISLRRSDNLVDVLDELFHVLRTTQFELDLQLVRDINRGLAFLDNPNLWSKPTTEEARGVLRMAGRLTQVPGSTAPYRKLTVHRHHPVLDLSGAFGATNFTRENIEGLISRGFDDVVKHDCAANGCIFPD